MYKMEFTLDLLKILNRAVLHTLEKAPHVNSNPTDYTLQLQIKLLYRKQLSNYNLQ